MELVAQYTDTSDKGWDGAQALLEHFLWLTDPLLKTE
jgi:hypothetical protein